EGRPLVQMGTLSKALGGLGGFVAGSRDLIAYLVNRARAFIYTTALPPALAAAAIAALDVIEDEPERRERLGALRRRLHHGVREGLSGALAGTAGKRRTAHPPPF